jgi:hypothetical protein
MPPARESRPLIGRFGLSRTAIGQHRTGGFKNEKLDAIHNDKDVIFHSLVAVVFTGRVEGEGWGGGDRVLSSLLNYRVPRVLLSPVSALL